MRITCREIIMKKFFQYLNTQTFRKNLIAALIFIIVLLTLIFFSLRIYTRHNSTIPVPELLGLHIDEAIKILDNSNLEYEIDSVYQVDAQPGIVIDQDPVFGKQVKEERRLYLTIITKSAPDVGFPELLEKTFVEARAMINNYGLKLGDTVYRADIARDVVLEARFGGQAIHSGRTIPKGSTVDLILGDGRGANEVEVPYLIGLTLDEVRFVLRGASLTLGNIEYSGFVSDSTSAVVKEQRPGTDISKVGIGSSVNIVLGN